MTKEHQINVLIDADVLCYKASSAIERAHRWDDGVWTYTADENEAINAGESLLIAWCKKFKTTPDDAVLCFSSSTNFRKQLYPEYKANRKDLRKPLTFKVLKEHLCANYSSREKPNLEADDVLGILATKTDAPTVIVSIDKDLKQIPGLHWDPDKGGEPTKISSLDGDLHFYTQTLIGDMAVDNFPGCPGIGAVRAKRALDDVDGDYWSVIVGLFEEAGLTEEDALLQARLARILRASDYDFVKKEVIPWAPVVT